MDNWGAKTSPVHLLFLLVCANCAYISSESPLKLEELVNDELLLIERPRDRDRDLLPLLKLDRLLWLLKLLWLELRVRLRWRPLCWGPGGRCGPGGCKLKKEFYLHIKCIAFIWFEIYAIQTWSLFPFSACYFTRNTLSKVQTTALKSNHQFLEWFQSLANVWCVTQVPHTAIWLAKIAP